MENFTLRHTHQRGYGVYTKRSWKMGEKVLRCDGRVVPTYMADVHHAMTLTAHFSFEWDKGYVYNYVNHSCKPNCYVDLSDGTPTLTALRNISSDEEICYNYNTVEVDLTKNRASFLCHCENSNCKGWIRGFLYLTPAWEKEILEICSPFIKEVQVEYEKNREGTCHARN